MFENNIGIPADMLEAIETFDNQCKAIVDNFFSENYSQQIPDRIYHYTDSTGLLGILKSGKVRLSDISSLNDPSELKHGLIQASEMLNEESKVGHPAVGIFASIFKTVMVENVGKIARLLVACFSCDGDDLGQWRAYGDNGGGFAIGFDGKLIDEAFVKEDAHRHVYSNGTFHVNYDDSKLRGLQRQLINGVLPLIAMPSGRNLENDLIKRFLSELSIRLSFFVINTTIGFKHEAYRNEQEYRFLQVRGIDKPADNLEHRVRGTSLISFSEFDWKVKGANALRDIVIGPAADESDARLFVDDCLSLAGLVSEDVTVHRSNIPYRNK